MARHEFPARLVQVLADVFGVLVIGRVPLHRLRPVVCRPENLDACGARAGAPSAEAGEQVDCCCHEVFFTGSQCDDSPCGYLGFMGGSECCKF